MMTVANQITVFRILLIPVFVGFALYYGQSVSRGAPEEWLRFSAITVFVIASVTDAFDGWVARRLGQVSKFGTILDPIADKGLLLTAIITLSVSPWHYSLPLWFPVLVIARDVVIVVGCVVVQIFGENLVVTPSLIGKTATALQMVAVTGVMLQIPHFEPVVWAAGAFTLASGIGYLFHGVAQLAHLDNSGSKS
jgi:CDP-diacylglycerol--glycerol-3-phosphate 3-phosphatidyltransferase